MKNELSATEIKEQLSILDFLSRLGHQPVKKSGKEHFYLSMIRDSDTSPSFCVKDELGVWYDHGQGIGGNIIGLAMEYWHLNFKEAVIKINDMYSHQLSLTHENPRTKQTNRPRLPIEVPHYKVEDVKPLGNNPIITSYLQSRGVYHVASPEVMEVYYYVEDEMKNRKQFFAAGWETENGGWEVRNKHFKGCLGHKGMTFIPGKRCDLAVFEGFFNYLSWRAEHRNAEKCVLVLNTLSLLKASIARTHAFEKVEVFFDRDPSGFKATEQFLKQVPRAKDRSFLYNGFGDYNDKTCAELRDRQRSEIRSEFRPSMFENRRSR